MRWGSQASITVTFCFVEAPYYQTVSLGDIISNLLVFSACTGIALQQYSTGPSNGWNGKQLRGIIMSLVWKLTDWAHNAM